MNKWIPINDYPGDQQYDIPFSTEQYSYWAEIGRGGKHETQWSWTILRTDDAADQQEVDGGLVNTEAEAKAIVETWSP